MWIPPVLPCRDHVLPSFAVREFPFFRKVGNILLPFSNMCDVRGSFTKVGLRELVWCQAFFHLVLGMWGICWWFGACISWVFKTSVVINSWIECLWMAPKTHAVIMMRGLIICPPAQSLLYEWVVFSGFFFVGGEGKSNHVAIGEYYEFYDIWGDWCLGRGGGVWLPMGAPNTYKMYGMSLARHVHKST